MKIPSPSPKKRARLEIIPLIDIVFFLLATFAMVSLSMVKNQGISVNLPIASTANTQDSKNIVTITVKETGEIFLNKNLVSSQELTTQLTHLKNSDSDLKVLINGDEKAYFGKAILVLDEVRRLGITKVSIRTKNK